MRKIDLDKSWKLLEAPLFWKADMLGRVQNTQEGLLHCDLPCDVHMPLQENGIIKDVVVGDNCFDAEWTEKRSWWFIKEFETDESLFEAEKIEIVLTMVDAHSDIFLNGEHIGRHESAFYPFTASVKSRLRKGTNSLIVRVTSGLENVTEEQLSAMGGFCGKSTGNRALTRGDDRRFFVRRPQYSIGWDWAPKAVTCGITGHAFLRVLDKATVRGAHVATKELDKGEAKLLVTVEVENTLMYSTIDADVSVEIYLHDEKQASAEKHDVLLTSGINYIDLPVTVKNAQLWWPAGSGEQPLYEVRVCVTCENKTDMFDPFLYGIRTVELDTARTGEKTRNFCLIVNGEKIFCKGGDWIPSDSIYARVTEKKYNTLISEAKEANFNMLRIWGGGLYEAEAFYNACDREGILIWHDFMFGCGKYPDHSERFAFLVRKEMEYQVRRLRNHPCMALWCGNNEDHWQCACSPQILELDKERGFGMDNGNFIAKEALHMYAPEIPYWNSSPYGGEFPNDDDVGDVHHWFACMMNPDMEKRIEPREYDKVQARFVTEYGYPGPCCKESITQYLGGAKVERGNKLWNLHNNEFEKKTVNAGIVKHYRDDAAEMSTDNYLLYAGMVQSLMLGYSLEAIRFKDFCNGALFWMYNDAWGETGWTIIDYYTRRKIAFYGVKRAFAPVKLTLRLAEGNVLLQGANDTGKDIEVAVNTGWATFDGKEKQLTQRVFTLKAHERTLLLTEKLPEKDITKGTYVAIPECDFIAPEALYLTQARNRVYSKADVRITTQNIGDDLVVKCVSDVFVHGVYADTDKRCSDNYFDLLPGVEKAITIYDCGNTLPRIASVLCE